MPVLEIIFPISIMSTIIAVFARSLDNSIIEMIPLSRWLLDSSSLSRPYSDIFILTKRQSYKKFSHKKKN